MYTLITLFKIYLGFFVENIIFSSLLYGIIFRFPLAILFSIMSYLNILLWVYLKPYVSNYINNKISFLSIFRPISYLSIETSFCQAIFTFSEYGMPSLHSVFSAYTAIFWSLYMYRIKKEKSYYNILALFLLYLLVVGSRIYFQVHTLGQVLVGTIIGLITGYISYYFSQYIFNIKGLD